MAGITVKARIASC